MGIVPTGTDNALVLTDVQSFYSPDKTDDLLDLIEKWCAKKIDRPEFRRQLVMGFTWRTWGEPLDAILMAIEGIFVDFDLEGGCIAQRLEDRIFTIAGIVEAMQMKRPPEARRFFRHVNNLDYINSHNNPCTK